MSIQLCPLCRKAPSSTDPKIKPFCCERCKTIDLGNWLSESYRVPESSPTSDDSNEDAVDPSEEDDE